MSKIKLKNLVFINYSVPVNQEEVIKSLKLARPKSDSIEGLSELSVIARADKSQLILLKLLPSTPVGKAMKGAILKKLFELRLYERYLWLC